MTAGPGVKPIESRGRLWRRRPQGAKAAAPLVRARQRIAAVARLPPESELVPNQVVRAQPALAPAAETPIAEWVARAVPAVADREQTSLAFARRKPADRARSCPFPSSIRRLLTTQNAAPRGAPSAFGHPLQERSRTR